MSRKKQTDQKPVKEKQFSTNPFAVLKGVQLADTKPAVAEPVKPAPVRKAEPAEEELFLQAMSGVQRLEVQQERKKNTQLPQAGVRPQSVRTTAASRVLPREEVKARRTFLQEVEKLQLDVRFEDSLPEDEELRPLSGNRLRQLKRGIIELDRQLDLHGLTREEAVESLAPFLQSARTAGEKAVLVITGKGVHSVEAPVLQQVVTSWLRDQGRELITEYAPAPSALGGSGAFVIFLRPLDK